MNKLILPIRGMHCKSCEIMIEEKIKEIDGVTEVNVNHKLGKAEVHFKQRPTDESLKAAVQNAGYQIGEKEKLPLISTDPKDYKDLAKAALILFILYLIGKKIGLFNLEVNTDNYGIFLAPLVVGLIAGVSTCMALVGGLVLGLAGRHAEIHPEATPMQKFRPHLFFNFGRILGYTLFGGLIGLLGSAFKMSSGLVGILTMIVGGVMIFLGLKLIEIFPALRDKTISLPTGIAKMFGLNKEVREYSHKSAMLTGALTFFLPCGFTQAMQIYAIGTGSFLKGALVMALFAVGTAPGLLGIGGLTAAVKGQKARLFFMTAGLAVIFLGWYNIANASRLFSAGKVIVPATESVVSGDVQEIRMTQDGSGYKPNVLTVEKGKKVRWIINSTNSYTCAASIAMASMGINQQLERGENIIEFTPTEVGELPFSCSMGMYRGKFIVK